MAVRLEIRGCVYGAKVGHGRPGGRRFHSYALKNKLARCLDRGTSVYCMQGQGSLST